MTTQSDPLEIIAAFVDGERVDPEALKTALETPEGRDYLVEMIALHEVVTHELIPPAVAPARPSSRWLLAAAAAIVLSLAGGYSLGHRATPADGNAALSAPSADAVAPPPTRVIEVRPGSSYVNEGRKQ